MEDGSALLLQCSQLNVYANINKVSLGLSVDQIKKKKKRKKEKKRKITKHVLSTQKKKKMVLK